MKKIFLITLLFFSSLSFVSANNFIQTKVDGHLVKIIKYDTLDNRYQLKVAVNPDYEATNLKELTKKYNGISAVNGVFLCPADYYECGGKDFTKNERYVEGYKYARETSTGDRAVFAWDQFDSAFIYQTDRLNPDKENSIYYGLANFPLLLHKGESALAYYEEKGLIDAKMKSSGTRNFICVDSTKRFIMTGFVYSATMYEMPEILKKMGCSDALNLDAGKTSAMIYNGRQIIWEGRKMLDAVVVERKGLDVQAVSALLDKNIEIFTSRLETNDIDTQVAVLRDILKKTPEIRAKLYDKNSINLYDELGAEIGYEIKMNELNDVATMYVVNTLEAELSAVLRTKEAEQKKLRDAENLLF